MPRRSSLAAVTLVRSKHRAMLMMGMATLALAIAFAWALNARAATPGLVSIDEVKGGALLLRTTEPGYYAEAPNVASDITVDVSGPIARTRITQRFENPADGWVEGIYLFPLPEDAAVDVLKIQIGDHFIEGTVKERQEARAIYETAKATGQKAGLFEQERPNLFTNSVANIGPHETVVVQIEYQEQLKPEKGASELRLPLVAAPRYMPRPTVSLVSVDERGPVFAVNDPVPDSARLEAPVRRPEWGSVNPVTLTVKLQAGFPIDAITSPSHKIAVARNGQTGATVTLAEGDVPADRDFVLRWSAKAKADPTLTLLKEEVDGQTYLMAFVVPPTGEQPSPVKPRETIFVIDNSGSMAGPSMREARKSLALAIDRLNPQDRFNVIRFDDTMERVFPAVVPATAENIAYAKRFVNALEANGGTEMGPAIEAALFDPNPGDASHLRQIVFLTDGAVGNEADVFAKIRAGLGRSRLFTVGIGSAPNSYFMTSAARAGRGTYTFIASPEEVEERMERLFTLLANPVMTDLEATWTDGVASEIWPAPLPDLYAGEPVVIAARAERMTGTVTLTGLREGVRWKKTIDLAQAKPGRGIEKLWARSKIEALEEQALRGVEPALVDAALLAVALEHRLVSRLTSLVAVDVTPSRPQGEALTSKGVPLNLPAGWDFDKVFGEPFNEQVPAGPDMRRAQMTLPPAILATLTVRSTEAEAKAASLAGGPEILLPQGATDMRLLLLIGAFLLLLGAFLYRFGGARSQVRA